MFVLERFHSCSACIVPLAKSMGANSNLDLRGDTNCFNFSLFMQLLLFLCYGPFKRGSKRNSRKTSIAARGRGRIEFVHSLVCSGCVTIKDCLGETKEEIILPAQGVESTKSEAIGGNLVNSFERYLFGSSFDTFILTLAGKFSNVNFCCVGDSAGANLKLAEQLFSYLRQVCRKHGIFMTANFTPCQLHQAARILGLYLEHNALSTALFSCTRLHQHTNTRKKFRDRMKVLLSERFQYFANQRPPLCAFTTSRFRRNLFELLSGSWRGETEEEVHSARTDMVKQALLFFNGNISQNGSWSHYCNGCHKNEHEARQHVTRLHVLLMTW